MKAFYTILLIGLLLPLSFGASLGQPVVTNKNFSLGSTGRVGAGFSPSVPGNMGRSLNLLGHGSLGGRLEQGDYIDLLPALHFNQVNSSADTTAIVFQARIGMYALGGQYLGNVSTRSTDGLTIALPEAFVEARNIVGSQWSVWAGARYMRYDDVHITDYFYFDDHSSQGFGIKRKNSDFSMLFPAAIDAASTSPPYYYVNMIDGAEVAAMRQRTIAIGEHTIPLIKNGASVKLLGEYHYMPASDVNAPDYHPADKGWVIGAKHNTALPTRKPGSFNQFAVRYGTGIANGGDNGVTLTWATFGAPAFETKKYTDAYSVTLVEHIMLNLSDRLSLNGYGVFTKSKGGAATNGQAPDYKGNLTFNRKTDLATGLRSVLYLTNWLHLLNEAHYTVRQDGDQAAATMLKFTIAPTIVPTAQRDPWARPHIRFMFSAATYNQFAQQNMYSPFLQQAGGKAWGTYMGVRSEWWIF
ncbi:carbohydrate porin [Pontibacter qinzhouensis]|uniref:Carbohydrate porin n=1 Tax=Pontibacter qinzhouensis TaxID=2603253 RepID=A0A5C8K4Q5_9BACT|nr:carbohydrate porin [Pontibacter qinzhouensis]TXK44850.1 carbohydrate porin [Pontibacter qinzhouensis]